MEHKNTPCLLFKFSVLISLFILAAWMYLLAFMPEITKGTLTAKDIPEFIIATILFASLEIFLGIKMWDKISSIQEDQNYDAQQYEDFLHLTDHEIT